MRQLLRWIVWTCLAPIATSQSVLYQFQGDSDGDRLGASVSAAGDVNADGRVDFIIGDTRDDNNGSISGSARVISGLDGSVLYTFYGDSAGDGFGFSVSGAGDTDGDGFDDLIVGAPWDDNNGANSGSARVLSGMDGSVLYTFDGDSTGDAFGTSVSGAGDMNGDGFDDLIVGAPWADTNKPATGIARVFSGVDGSVLYTFEGDNTANALGYSVSDVGDINSDGFDDVIVGAPQPSGLFPGFVRVFSGFDGSLIFERGGGWTDEFGVSVSGAGDVNGDGVNDMIIGETKEDPCDASEGNAYVISGVNGSSLWTFGSVGNILFGRSVSGAGDVNGDGFADLVVGAPFEEFGWNEFGSIRVFSGLDGSTLLTLNSGLYGSEFGASVGGVGDVNGDGLDDLIVGAPSAFLGNELVGMVRIIAGGTPLGTPYCSPAVVNSSGQPAEISASGTGQATSSNFFILATNLPTEKFGYFLVGMTQGFIANPAGSQGNLCLQGQIGRFRKQVQNSGQIGEISIQVDLTNLPTNPPSTVFAGQTWNFQAWFRDQNPGSTSNFSNGVSVLFQ